MNGWTEWQPVQPAVTCTPEVLGELIDGGQAFRWNFVEGAWRGVWANCLVELRTVDDLVQWRAPERISERVGQQIAKYLGGDTTYAPIWDALPYRSDPALASAMARWPGLRILRQPFGETVLCFLCSSMKQIPSIKLICATLAEHFGREIVPGVHALPDWATLHHVSETELRSAGLGYRARHIHAASHFLAGQPGWLDVVETLPYPEAKERLMQLPGVGAKIADCALLFGAGRLEAFPVDTWINRIMAEHYGLDGWKIDQVAHFGRVHFGEYAGLAQQFLFSNARRG